MEALSLGSKFATGINKSITTNTILSNYRNCDTDFSKVSSKESFSPLSLNEKIHPSPKDIYRYYPTKPKTRTLSFPPPIKTVAL